MGKTTNVVILMALMVSSVAAGGCDEPVEEEDLYLMSEDGEYLEFAEREDVESGVEALDVVEVDELGPEVGDLVGAAPIELVARTKDDRAIELQLDPSQDQIELRNLSEAPVDGARDAINWGTSLWLGQGEYKYYYLNASAGKPYFITTTPDYGDPDILLYKKVNGSWVQYDSSELSSMRVDRRTVKVNSSEQIIMLFYAYSSTGFTASVSWESGGKLDLDVPYLNQNDIPVIGEAACSSASAAMVLATHGEARVDGMISAAEDLFADTASLELGLLNRDYLRDALEDDWGMHSVHFDKSNWPQLYATIKEEIRAGRPMILGSKSMSSAGHYVVVRGFIGSDYSSAKLIINDPNGTWNWYNNWTTSSHASGVEYNYKTITSVSSDGVFVVVP